MTSIDTRAILKNIMKRPQLRNIALLCLSAVVIYPLYDIVYAKPSVIRILTNNVEKEAISLGEHCMREVFPDTQKLTGEIFTPSAERRLKEHLSDFRLEKVKMYSSSGEVLYSTDDRDLGSVNQNDYFKNIVAKGTTFTKVVRKDTKSMEGRIVARDVVETYVPIMRDDTFLGAFEIYYDITGRKAELAGLLASSSYRTLGLGTLFMVAVFLATFSASRTMLENQRIREKLEWAQEDLERQVRRRTAELAKVNEELKKEVDEGNRMQSALKKASSEWRVSFDATKDLLVMTDADLKTVKVNRATSDFFEKPYAELLGRDCLQLFAGILPAEGPNPLRMMTCSRRHEEQEVSLRDRERWFLTSADPILDASGRLSGAVFTLKDITDHKRARLEQERLQEELQQAQKMESIGSLAGGIAHDFNNILFSIMSYCEIAETKIPEDHPARRPLEIIKDAGDKAASIVRQLLAFSRKQVLTMEVIDLNDVIKNIARMLLRTIRTNIAFELKIEKPVKGIMGDKVQIDQVLLNLVVNARDAMPAGGALTIETENVVLRGEGGPGEGGGKQGPYVVLKVTDTGEGIPGKVREKMYEPFFTTKPNGKGTGLGLSTVYGIVRQHGGHIVVESEHGRGTTFKVYFPVSEMKEVKVMETPVEKSLPELRGSERILVVEDDSTIREAIIEALQPLGYRLLEASDGAEALRIIEEESEKIDLLLTDLVMPEVGGRELVEAILSKRPGTKVIVMSGYIENEADFQYFKKSGVTMVEKPILPSRFRKILRQVLDSG